MWVGELRSCRLWGVAKKWKKKKDSALCILFHLRSQNSRVILNKSFLAGVLLCLCSSAQLGWTEQAHGQSHMQGSLRVSGFPCVLGGNVSGATVLKAPNQPAHDENLITQAEKKTNPSTSMPTSMETWHSFKRPVLATLLTFIILFCHSRDCVYRHMLRGGGLSNWMHQAGNLPKPKLIIFSSI